MWCKVLLLVFLGSGVVSALHPEFYEPYADVDPHVIVRREAAEKKLDLNKTEEELGILIPPSSNISAINEDSHDYYNSTFITDLPSLLWLYVDLGTKPKAVTHPLLSATYRKAMTIHLSFDFPFYGDPIRNVTIATGGFLYVGEYLHNWIAATQYIAPLMANFNPTLNNDTAISYYDNGTALTVEWKNVILDDHPKAGPFSFQTTLYDNGNIAFVYIDIPLPIQSISNESHPVKVGLSDAYILEKQHFIFKRKIVYEYHKINLMDRQIGSKTALFFKALPTCSQYHDCQSCHNAQIGFVCFWCPTLQRCSTSIDRHRQDWLRHLCIYQIKACDETSDITTTTTVSGGLNTSTSSTIAPTMVSTTALSTTTTVMPVVTTVNSPVTSAISTAEPNVSQVVVDGEVPPYHPIAESQVLVEESRSGMGAGSVVAILLAVLAIITAIGWLGYAYRFPQSTSGQILIKYRPSQWKWASKPAEQPTLQM